MYLFNICEDNHPKRREYYAKTKLVLRSETPIFVQNELNNFKNISNKKLKRILSYKFKYSDLISINYFSFDD